MDIIKINKWLKDNNTNLICNNDKYINQFETMEFECAVCNSKIYKNWKQMRRTPKCKKCNEVWNVDKIKKYLINNNLHYKLLSNTYEGNTKKLTFKCLIDNYVFQSTWSNFINIKTDVCDVCRKNKIFNNFKEYIATNAIGYTLLENEYINSDYKMKFSCPENHVFKMNMYHFKEGERCPTCYKEKIKLQGSSKKFSYEFVKNYIEVKSGSNYKLLSKNYISNSNSIDIMCDKGHIYTTSFVSFYNLRARCPHCAGIAKHTYDYIKNFIEIESNSGYKLLSDNYINNRIKIKLECPEGHIWKTSFTNFQRGHRCWYCRNINNSGENHPRYNNGRTEINKILRQLLNNWKQKSLEVTNYTCVITGYQGKLKIHHLYSFNKIVTDVLKQLNLDKRKTVGEYLDDELNKIIELLLDYHNKNLGVPLHPKIHILYHKLYRYNNTIEQFEEFKTRLRLGEFNYFLEENNLKLTIK